MKNLSLNAIKSIFIVLTILACVVILFFRKIVFLFYLGIGLFLLAVAVSMSYYRCPKCGRQIPAQLAPGKPERCPYCQEKIDYARHRNAP